MKPRVGKAVEFEEDEVPCYLLPRYEKFFKPEEKSTATAKPNPFRFACLPKRRKFTFTYYPDWEIRTLSSMFYDGLKDDLDEEDEEKPPISFEAFKDRMSRIIRDTNHQLKLKRRQYANTDL